MDKYQMGIDGTSDSVIVREPLVKPTKKTKPGLRKPRMYKVYILNDDYTTMEFVEHVFQIIFHKDEIEAKKLTLEVHQKGLALGGVYTHEIAETKLVEVQTMAYREKFPLKATMEPE